jgi:hypothetical protein
MIMDRVDCGSTILDVAVVSGEVDNDIVNVACFSSFLYVTSLACSDRAPPTVPSSHVLSPRIYTANVV